MEFSKKHGLCKGLVDMYPDLKPDIYGCNPVQNEMLEQFKQAGFSMGFPFGLTDYTRRSVDYTMHKCSIRLKWAMEHAHNPPVNQSKELTEFYKAWHQWAIDEGINDSLTKE